MPWDSFDYATELLTPGVDNVFTVGEYTVMVPQENNARIVGLLVDDLSRNRMLEIANGDPTGTLSILLIGGLPGQANPRIVLPTGKTTLTIPPGFAQRIAYIVGIGFVPLIGGTLA